MNIVIKRANPQDWELMQKLNHELFEDNAAYDKYLDLQWPFTKGLEYYKKYLSNPTYCTLLAYDGDMPVGHIVGGPKDISYRKVKTAEIYEMGVSPEYRSRGIGSQLVTALRKWAKEQGYETLMVNAYHGNEKGVAFYKKQGLQPIDINLEMGLN
jgi:ribosomal protein S18 acetylase RimI-like enzyme